jgi:hypothetical protein
MTAKRKVAACIFAVLIGLSIASCDKGLELPDIDVNAACEKDHLKYGGDKARCVSNFQETYASLKAAWPYMKDDDKRETLLTLSQVLAYTHK